MSAKAPRRLRNALIVVLIFTALYAAYRYTLHRMVETKLDEIRKQGYPVTLAELDKWYPQPPSGENAADIYTQAFERYVKNASDTNLPVVGEAHTPGRSIPLATDMAQGISNYLATNQVALDLLHRATRTSLCRYPLNLSNPDKMIQSQIKLFGGARKGARLLCLEALSASANGDTQRATESIVASLALAESLNDRPLLISYLVEKACFGIAIFSLEQALSRATFTEAQLARLSAAFGKVEATNSLTRALTGERAWANEEWKEIREGKVSITDLTHSFDDKAGRMDRTAGALYRPSGLLDLDYVTFLNLATSLIESSTIAFPERLERIDSLKRKFEHIGVCPLTHMAASLFGDSVKQDARFIAQLRAACTSLEIERYRLANGTVPDSLGNLTPVFLNTVPADPHDGQPLRYRKLTKGYVVYSIGTDGKDDDGDEKKDITFTVER